MSRPATGTARLRVAALSLAAAASLLLSCGFWRGATPPEPASAPPPSHPAPAEAPAPPPPPAAEGVSGYAGPGQGTEAEPPKAVVPAVPQAPAGEAGAPGEAPPAPGAAALPAESGPPGGPPASQGGPPPKRALPQPPAPAKAGEAKAGAAPPAPDSQGKAAEGAAGATAARERAERAGRVRVARLPEHLAFDQSGPYWTRGREELVYRVEFLGITMGYARFVFNGKVLLGGREVYHLSVRAWTANVLALIYPIDDTIDYYMDVKTLEPLRQEYTSSDRKKNDVMIYYQDTGRIVYRYKESGKIQKEVNAVPNVYDPVTLAYFFRSREPGDDEKGKNVYAGRKVWEISAKPIGAERIVTERGEVDTVVIRPVIKRDGKLEDKGDLRMWMTRDERKVPVRVYAKFRKIRTWTLVGELMAERKGG